MAKSASHFLVKSEPFKYSWEQLCRDGQTRWDGVRNFEARNNLRAMRLGDLLLFYHSGEGKQIVGIARVVTAFTVVMVGALLVLAGLVFDGGRALAGRVTATNVNGAIEVDTALGTLSLPAPDTSILTGSAVQLRVSAVAPPLPGIRASLTEASVAPTATDEATSPFAAALSAAERSSS